MNKHFEKAFEAIQNAQNILINTHIHPDGDALGSLCALYEFLTFHKKNITAFVSNKPEQFNYLPHFHEILISEENESNALDYDLIICLDYNEMYRSDIEPVLRDAQKKKIPTLIFDHHPQKNTWADITIVDTKASSTTVLLHRFFKSVDFNYNQAISTALLTGLFTDTQNLSNTSTNQEAIESASELMNHGAKWKTINKHTIKNKSVEMLKGWGELLSRLTINEKYSLAYTVLTHEDLDEFDLDLEAFKGLSNFLSEIKGINAILVLKSLDDGTIVGSLRSINQKINVSQLAELLGGGGHLKAAGFTIQGELIQENNQWKMI